jgi:hypothetical protein
LAVRNTAAGFRGCGSSAIRIPSRNK